MKARSLVIGASFDVEPHHQTGTFCKTNIRELVQLEDTVLSGDDECKLGADHSGTGKHEVGARDPPESTKTSSTGRILANGVLKRLAQLTHLETWALEMLLLSGSQTQPNSYSRRRGSLLNWYRMEGVATRSDDADLSENPFDHSWCTHWQTSIGSVDSDRLERGWRRSQISEMYQVMWESRNSYHDAFDDLGRPLVVGSRCYSTAC